MRSLTIVLVLTGALVTAASAAAPAAPQRGVVVEGATFGGLPLGLTKAQVRAHWGRRFGVCRDCATPTWYYTFRPSYPQGIGVAFGKDGRSNAYFTLGAPRWRTRRGLAIGDPSSKVAKLYGNAPTVACDGYSVLQVVVKKTLLLAILDGTQVYGLGLQLRTTDPCR